MPFLVSVFWTSVLAWSLLAGRLAQDLKSRHPRVYASLARPAVASPVPFEPEIALLRFLLARRHARLGDARLARLGDAMRHLFLAYVAFFLAAPLLLVR
jgi:hypothetical protein